MGEVIRVENLSKLYRLGQIGTGTLAKDLNRWLARKTGRQDPYARIGQKNDRTRRVSESDFVWALKDINFSVNQGDVVGIIGSNGAGKSTLLKIISQITTPSTGSIKIKGRIASLLEVGTGFHPEMTGRENIFMNGTLLGMTRREIQKKFDEIVDFAGVTLYVDTPVKRYSSGMHVRLAFAVAAFLEPEILVVDEVLAVGDAEFQKKAIGRMQEISEGGGRTVLFVSHNMPTMQKLCKTGLLLKNGQVAYNGLMDDVIKAYLEAENKQSSIVLQNDDSMEACIVQAEVRDQNNRPASRIPIGGKWTVVVKYKINNPVRNFVCGIGVMNNHETPIKTAWQDPIDVLPGAYEATFEEILIDFAVGDYKVNIGLSQNRRVIQYIENALNFNIVPVVSELSDSVIEYNNSAGFILNPMKTQTFRIAP